jgi:hypothetical protein
MIWLAKLLTTARRQFCRSRAHRRYATAVRCFSLVLLVANRCCTATAYGQSNASSLSGSPLAHRLETRVSITWEGQQLGQALARLGEAQKIALWLDRRVDPDTPLDITATDRTLPEVLDEIGQPHGWSASVFAGIVYFGPRQTAEDLATLAALARQRLANAPAASRASWLKAETWSIPRLSQPRELLRDLVQSAGATLTGDEQISLDLWPDRKLPALAVIDRAVLVLSGFDLTCQVSENGRQLQVVPIKRPVQITRDYSVSSSRAADVERVLQQLSAQNIERRGARLVVSARVEAHEAIAAALRGRPPVAAPPRKMPKSVDEPQQRYSLRVDNKPVGAVVDQLAKQLKFEVFWEEGASTNSQQIRATLVSCNVRDVDADALLRAILEPAKLSFEREGGTVTIRRTKE